MAYGVLVDLYPIEAADNINQCIKRNHTTVAPQHTSSTENHNRRDRHYAVVLNQSHAFVLIHIDTQHIYRTTELVFHGIYNGVQGVAGPAPRSIKIY